MWTEEQMILIDEFRLQSLGDQAIWDYSKAESHGRESMVEQELGEKKEKEEKGPSSQPSSRSSCIPSSSYLLLL